MTATRARPAILSEPGGTSSAILILPERRSEWSTQLEASPIEMRAIEVVPDEPLIQTDITGTVYQIDSKTFVPTNSRIAGDYGLSEYGNYASATASGFEFTVSRPQGRWVQGSLSSARTRAEGLSDHENQGLNLAQVLWHYHTGRPYTYGPRPWVAPATRPEDAVGESPHAASP